MSRPAKRQRTHSPVRDEISGITPLTSLPSELLEMVASFGGEYSPAHQVTSKQWAQADASRCFVDTRHGTSCLRYDALGSATMLDGCTKYCLGREPCAAWLLPLLAALGQAEAVQLGAHGPVLPVVRAEVLVGKSGWLAVDLRAKEARDQAVLAVCDSVRREQADALALRLTLQSVPVPYRSTRADPVFLSRSSDFRADALPRTWFRPSAHSLEAAIDLRDRQTRGCGDATGSGKRCLETGRLPDGCTGYCLRQGGPCDRWTVNLLKGLEETRSVQVRRKRHFFYTGQNPTLTFRPDARARVLDASGRHVLELRLVREREWLVSAEDQESRAVPLAEAAFLLCAALASPRAESLLVALELPGHSREGVEAGELARDEETVPGDYLFRVESYDTSPPVSLQWNLRLTRAPALKFALEAVVPLRPH